MSFFVSKSLGILEGIYNPNNPVGLTFKMRKKIMFLEFKDNTFRKGYHLKTYQDEHHRLHSHHNEFAFWHFHSTAV
jgi:hypothetical protein